MQDPAWLTATEARARMANGRLSAETLVRACLARIAARDDDVRAWAALQPEAAIARARELDALQAAGHPLGPLHGVPVGVKDVIATADLPTGHNSPLRAGERPGVDAACVRLLRQAGAVIVGKTDTVEFAATGRRAATRNPHDLRHTPGGSSSGSAAAVADGQVPLALGTQTGGSTIRPASFCGVFALKPTWGLVSREGIKHYAPTLDTLGWMARSAEDLALLLQVFEPPLAWRGPVDAAAAVSDAALDGVRIAVCRTPMWAQAEAPTRAALADAEARLAAAGARVRGLELPPRMAGLPALQGLIMRAEGGVHLLDEHHLHGDALEASLRDQVLNVAGTTPAQLCAAWDEAAACRTLWDAVAARYDAVLTPSTPGVAPAGLQNTGDLVFNGLWTLLHAPCVNLPWGWDARSRLPVGLTLTGPRFADRRLLALAAAMARLMPAAPTTAPAPGAAPMFALRKPAAPDAAGDPPAT